MSVLWLLALLGCDRIGSEDVIDRYDFDRDGHHAIASGGDDCDDRDADVNPSADEVCGDGVDNNCDGGVDDSGTGEVTWFVDDDGDGFGEAEVVACAKPEGAVAAGGDCDDGDVDVHPGAAERCDGVDQDCDGKIDDGLDVETQYADADGDGYGDDAVSESRCVSAGDAWVVAGGDCDDGDAAVNPGATEAFYDGIDQDCDGGDDNDADGDGVAAVAQGGADCDDTDAAVRPSASEVCGDGVDNNCDGAVDDDGTGGGEWYIDDDGDGYGDLPVSACTRPDGSALLDGDCDDADPSRFPNATELCDGEDQDCDGTPDDGLATTVHYEDTDGDGYGVASSTDVRCERNDDGWALLDGDCDDGAASINPGATEVYYDGVDANCDGANDDDADGDGVVAEARGGADCDDTDAAVNPSAEEVCGDGVDQDCAGLTEKCRFPESGELGEPLVSASALSDEADLSFGDLNGDGEMDVAVNGGDNGAFVVFGPLADGGSDPVDVGSILWGMDILETGSGDSYLATISSESHGNSVEVYLESDLESPFMSIDYGSEHIGDAYGVDDSIWVVSDGGVRGFEIVEGRFDMMDSAESLAYPPGDGWRFAVVGCQYLFCMQNAESWLGVMIESRFYQAARFGLRALGLHPVMPSTLRSNSSQRPLFA